MTITSKNPRKAEFWPSHIPIHVLTLVAVSLAVLPVLSAQHLPLLDSAAHIARIAVLRDLIITGAGSPFYSLDTLLLPNVAFDILGIGLVNALEPETVARLFFALTLVLMLTGTLVLNRIAIGRWSVAPLVSSFLLFNLVSILGFFSYIFGLALMLWALAMRLSLERSAWVWRTIFGVCAGVLLLMCHVFAFGIYAVMVIGVGVAAMTERRIGLRRLAGYGLEQIPACLLYLAMSAHQVGAGAYKMPFWQSKMFGLAKAFTSGSFAGDMAFVLGAVSFGVLLVTATRFRLARSFWPGLAALVLLYLALPFSLNSGSYVDSRMPIAIVLLGLAGTDMQILRGVLSNVFLAVLGGSLLAKQLALTMLWASVDPQIDAIVTALRALPKNAIIMQLECHPEESDVMNVYRSRQPPLTHAAALAGLDGTRYLPNVFAIKGQQPIQVVPAYQPFYQAFQSFGASVCTRAEYVDAVRKVQNLAVAKNETQYTVHPLYLLLIRPPAPHMLDGVAMRVAAAPAWEVYAIAAGQD
ncbi:hypothetical protein SAMN05216404_101277 [Nitrosospira multiformis]|uniref:Glucosyl transferase GtrII n=1 Tax=Nitrosospira multiformis TaxID=1231 RepID=A0A1H8BK86_9PROT|nr:hypothetical protein [Nitrosospira multiformis]SEM83196.1 hypothetical protein SAMN05216404_101277 [Nitrosospira multiformis]